MKKYKSTIGIGLAITAVFVLFVLVILLRGFGVSSENGIEKVTILKDGQTVTVSSDGRVQYSFGGESYEEFWSSDKTRIFFDYIGNNYLAGDEGAISGGRNYITVTVGGQKKSYLLGDDELVSTVVNESSGGGGSGGSSGGSGGSGGSGSGGSGGSSGGSSGGGSSGGSSECLYWRLSYCVRLRTPTPTPAPVVPTEVEIRDPDCEANTQTGRTVIGNELCFPELTPEP